MKEQISAKAEIACTKRQQKSNGSLLLSSSEKDMPQKESYVGSGKATILVWEYGFKPIRR